MKKLLILILLPLMLGGCNEKAKNNANALEVDDDTLCTTPECSIMLQPYDDFTQKDAKTLMLDLEKHLDPMLYGVWSFKVLPTKKMQADWYYKPRNRYRADKIIHALQPKRRSSDTVIIALAHHDISTTILGHKDYGIMGLSYRPGNACVVSTYRLKNRSQLWKVATHEFIHAFYGYPHCPKNNPHCIMQDAHGKNTFDMKNDLCDYCKSRIG